MRERLYEIISPAEPGDMRSRLYDIFMVVVSVLSLVPLMFRLEQCPSWFASAITLLDYITVYLLILDYLFRWITWDIKTKGGFKAILTYPFTPVAIINLLGILPSLGVLPQIFRFLRVFRLGRLFYYSKNLIVVFNAFMNESRTLLSVFYSILIYLVFVALLMFINEPESFPRFFDAFTWAVSQLTSTSLSSTFPQSIPGKITAIITSVIALFFIALPAGVITGSYVSELKKSKAHKKEYFEVIESTGMEAAKQKGFSLSAISDYFAQNLKVKRYLIIILATFLGASIVSQLLHMLNIPLWLDETSLATVSILLDPVAGIIVGLMMAAEEAIICADAAEILFIFSYAFSAVIYGIYFKHLINVNARSILKVFLLLTFVGGSIEILISLLVTQGNVAEANSFYLEAVDYLPLSFLTIEDFPLLLFIVKVYLYCALSNIFVIALSLCLSRLLYPIVQPSKEELMQQARIGHERELKRKREDERDELKKKRDRLLRNRVLLEYEVKEFEEQREQIAEELESIRAKKQSQKTAPIPPVDSAATKKTRAPIEYESEGDDND